MDKKKVNFWDKWFKKSMPKVENYPKGQSDVYFANRYSGSYGSGDERVKLYGYDRGYIVKAIVDLIAKKCTMVNWHVLDKDGKECEIDGLNSGRSNPLLKRPAPNLRWSDFIQDCVTTLLLDGNLYIRAEKGKIGADRSRVSYMYPLPAFQTIPYYIDGQLNSYRVTLGLYRNFSRDINKNHVLHIRMPNPNNGNGDEYNIGKSPFESVLEEIFTVNQSVKLGVNSFKNIGATKLLYVDNDSQLNENQADGLRKKILQTLEGVPNIVKTAISSEKMGMVDLTIDMNKILMLNQRIAAAKQICSVAHVPFNLIYPSDIAGGMNEIRELNVALWNDAIIPLLTKIEEGFNSWLMPTYDMDGTEYKLKYDLSHIDALSEKTLAKAKVIQQVVGRPVMTLNEGRAMLNLHAMENGDELTDVNMMPKAGNPRSALEERTPEQEITDNEYNDTGRM